jgi:hypothetical protein
VRAAYLLGASVATGCVLAAVLAGCRNAPTPTSSARAVEPHVAASSDVAAGRYLIVVGGCNDCHTPGWTQSGGKTPEAQWLTGSPRGQLGPWGTTYPQNLRTIPTRMSEEQFVTMLRTRTDRPPMPWMSVNRLQTADARAIYRFLKALGPAGSAMPAGLAPGEEPTSPYVVLIPQVPKRAK